jgi:hypothetical protein
VPTCARGCTARGRHLPTCSDGTETSHSRESPDACGGCLPRSATVGLLCEPCAGRVTRALLDAPHLVAWLRENVAPGAASDAPRVAGTREAPAPLSLTAVDDIDTIVTALVVAVMSFCKDTTLVGPQLVGVRAVVLDKTRARVIGIRSEVAPEESTAQFAAWLIDHLEGVAAQPWAPAWATSVTHAVASASKRFPRADPARKLPIPCPSCDRLLLYMHPPFAAGHPTTVTCHGADCARVLTEADYWLRAQTLYSERTRKVAP